MASKLDSITNAVPCTWYVRDVSGHAECDSSESRPTGFPALRLINAVSISAPYVPHCLDHPGHWITLSNYPTPLLQGSE